MNYIHENKVNKKYECNLLHAIINHYKRTRILRSHYSPIIHVCMNTKGVEKILRMFKSNCVVDVIL